MSLQFTSDARPPSNVTLLPNSLIRPAFGELYGFDADADADKAWTPAEINTFAWYDASDSSTITKNALNEVSQWNDKSGNGNHATQTTGASQPSTNTSTRNGLNVLDFSSDFLVSPININRSTMPDLSIFTVFASKSTTGNDGLFGSDNGGWDRFALLNFDLNEGAEWGISNAEGTIPFEPARTPDTDYHVLSIVLDNGVSNGSLVSLDGATPTAFTESAGDGSHNTTAIGALNHKGHYSMNAYLAEMIFIDSLVSTSDRHKIEGYLAHKWGLVANLPSGHPYKSSAPIN